MTSLVRPTAGLAVLGLATGLFTSTAIAASPFETLAGSWSGSGTAMFQSGSKERLSCNGYYRTGEAGTTLNLAIRCASTANKIEFRGRMAASGGKISGTWEERSYHATGSLSGTVAPGSLRASFSGAITGSLIVSFSRNSQTVTVATSGTALDGVSLSMRRR